jgi:hypothetical protein
MVAVIAITLGVIFFFINLAYGADIISNLIFCIGILVANIPEGLQICDSLYGTNCEEDGGQEGACEKPLVGGDTGLHFLHLLRQDWYSHPKQDDRFSPVLWKLACRCRNKL